MALQTAKAGDDISFLSPSGVRLDATSFPDSPIIDAFYSGYDRAFVLPDEKEGLAGFRDCLALNHGAERARLEARYGRFREYAGLLVEDNAGATVGGANFIAFVHDGGAPRISIALNYIFVDGAHRGKGILRRALQTLLAFAPHALGLDPAIVPSIFIEQNDPLAMGAAEYARDSAHSGTDQFARLEIWTRMGARIIDHAYVQPPLSAAQAAEDGLLLAVMHYPGATMDACFLADHLERFFAISVLKGRALDSEPSAQTQIDALRADCAAGDQFALLTSPPGIAPEARGSGEASLRTFLRKTAG
jgi:GNAT superfamily N-acetyltransferase